MDGPPTEIETRQLEELIQAVDDLRRRVNALEQRPFSAASQPEPEFQLQGPTLPASSSTNLLAALGRVLLGIAGAYLLRAITEATLLTQLAGIIAGLLYAGAWLMSVERLRPANPLISACHAVTAALIAGPLLWEATVRFHTLSAWGSAATLAAYLMAGRALARRRELSIPTIVTALAGAVTALALVIATLDPVPFTVALVLAAAAFEYGASRDQTHVSRWIIAAAADFCAFLILYVATRSEGMPDGYAPIPAGFVIAIPVALAAIYLTSFVFRTLARAPSVAWMDVIQVAISAALGIAAGLRAGHGAGVTTTGAICLAAGVLSYLVVLRRATVPRQSFHLYATFGILFIAIGCLIEFPALVECIIWSAIGVAATAYGEHHRENALRSHGALFLAAAAGVSGIFSYDPMRSRASPAELTAIAAAVLAYGWMLRLRTTRSLLLVDRIPAAVLAGTACWSIASLASVLFMHAHLDVSITSTFRTAVIAVIAVSLAWFGPRNLTELIWVLFPWMILGALKLFVEDFRVGRPATLFLSLLLYGATLIALPRLLRRAELRQSDLS